ncbi:MAG TPA: hypothetical protein VMW57_05540 [Methyloceanibacter sp.]|nr:hypothetical protein [Methyloceanibacter sp.]
MHSSTAHRTWRLSLPRWVVGALIYGCDVRVGGVRHAPGPDDGTYALPDPAPSGFVWPYLSEGKSFSDAPDLVFVMPGFGAPFAWTEHLLRRARKDLVRITVVDDWVPPIRKVSIAPGISVGVPQFPSGTNNRAFCDWCERVGRDLLLMGGLEPDGCEVVIYSGPLAHPLTWDTPGPTRPLKTFGRDAR